ncbi:MAG: zinc ribbon domain-containing protein [Actinobacteria bacterium]|nr:zinc ribbon domain-containing protein [Actinomycetota bacterium]
MPVYGYRCFKCEKEFETLQNMGESAVQPCPECGSEAKRLYYPVGIIFKGSGFHVNDYPSKHRKTPEDPKGESGETLKSPEDASSSKPADVKVD